MERKSLKQTQERTMRLTRGCGYRKIGALYLEGKGTAVKCGKLPLEIPSLCPTCGEGIRQSRGMAFLKPKFFGLDGAGCGLPTCENCPLGGAVPERICLMWVGKTHYTPAEFVKEATAHGVSKRVAGLPRGLKIGEDWVFLAHPEGKEKVVSPEDCTCRKRQLFEHIEKSSAVIYVFCPTDVTMPVDKNVITQEEIVELNRRGITPLPCDVDENGYAIEYTGEENA